MCFHARWKQIAAGRTYVPSDGRPLRTTGRDGMEIMDDWFDGAGANGSRVDVPKLLDGPGGDGIWELAGSGALVSLGLTRDGGALGITVTVDGRWRREYFRDPEELQVWVSEALPAVRAAVAALAASAERGSRQRRTRGL